MSDGTASVQFLKHVHIHASPLGKRAGLFHAASKDASFTLIVLPKPWSVRSSIHIYGENAHAVIVACECEAVVVAVAPSLAALLDSAQKRINDEAEKNRLLRCRTPGADAVALDDDEEALESSLNQLVRIRSTAALVPSRTACDSTIKGPPSTLSGTLSGHLLTLIQLASRSSSQDQWQHRSAPNLDDAGAHIDASDEPKSEDPLRLIAQWMFVENIESRMQRIRRGYVPVEETAPVIRGRITQRGLMQAASLSTPNIECAHDEFTDTTPLFRVLVSALDHVASGALAAYHGVGGWSVLKDVQDKAVHLRRQLAPIPSFPLPIAAEHARRLTMRPLPRMLREWQDALDLARTLLRDEGTTLRGGADGGSSQHWWFDTSKLWEGIVEQVLVKAYPGDRLVQAQGVQDRRDNKEGPESDRPVWVGIGSCKRPDFMLQATSEKWVVVDAKYKPLGATSLSASDQYQMFAYASLAAGWDRNLPRTEPLAVAVVYPRYELTTGKEWFPSSAEHLTDALQYSGGGDRKPHIHPRGDDGAPLVLVALPFPAETDVCSPEKWDSFIAKALPRGS